MTEESRSASLVLGLLPEIDEITGKQLRDSVLEVWLRAWRSSAWERLAEVPKSVDLPSRRTLTVHSRSVARMSAQMADTVTELHGVPVDRDAVLAIALLHDVCKVHEFEPAPDGTGRWSVRGRRFQHGFLGAHWMLEAGMAEDLVHAVIAHTPHSTVLPQTQEAVIVHYADFADSDVQLLDAGQRLFCKRRP
ncbi:HD domain-containing protein [Sciscionella sediminilitoris]|uniref:HD domain-containing protein n=1 Tax=Sciscionella sediminilitoris TaxID=1445613 RepID=UPI0004DEECDA|nr:HD domain-containing protein [Sciscionella sp. SE31]